MGMIVDVADADLTDAELAHRLSDLSSEQKRRSDLARAEADELRAKRTAGLISAAKATPGLIDALAPEHVTGRYGEECSDESPGRGLDWEGDPKDWDCSRCKLLNLVHEDWRDPADWELRFSVEGA